MIKLIVYFVCIYAGLQFTTERGHPEIQQDVLKFIKMSWDMFMTVTGYIITTCYKGLIR